MSNAKAKTSPYLTIGATLYRALDAAKILEEKYGMSAEVIDARSLVPFNYEKVIESVKKPVASSFRAMPTAAVRS
jgi:2-oxoisovalerate dehydrogenase E1 component